MTSDQIWEEATAREAYMTKVPGKVPPCGKLDHEVLAFRKSLEKKTMSELKDLLARQDAILNNTQLMAKLPDKGGKVREKKKYILDIIESKTDETATMLANMTLVDTEAMEWKQKPSSVLKILASKEVPDKTDENLEALMNASSAYVHAPFKQVKRVELDETSKAKIPLKHQKQKDGIKTRQTEVMPLPPANYESVRLNISFVDY